MNTIPISEEEKQKKQQEFFERARKGVLRYLDEKGGKLTLGELHEYSMNKFLIQHQSFSRMMETFVGEDLVFYDQMTQEAMITEQGKAFVGQN
jgi:hypothetical protein